ncbi:uncharacterized protein LOC112553858 [Pomacea canaliculata]|uniref:uncharacterized protein LOC112553858 n=1 Tax=Pomacea canaliculata TaxID=400727 RepID=UPI000D73F03E|nr:uncharacterized protein LOC112553858 [Pomacea canaliculata]
MSIKCQGDEKDISKCHISMGSCPSQQYMSVSCSTTPNDIDDTSSTHSSNTPVDGGITEAQAQSTVNAAAIAVPIIVILLVASVSVVVMYKFHQRRKAIPHQRFDMGVVEGSPYTLSDTSQYMTGASEITLGSDGSAHYTNQSNGQTQSNGDDGYANPCFNVVEQADSSKQMDKNGVY